MLVCFGFGQCIKVPTLLSFSWASENEIIWANSWDVSGQPASASGTSFHRHQAADAFVSTNRRIELSNAAKSTFEASCAVYSEVDHAVRGASLEYVRLSASANTFSEPRT